jgi:hypothetical protein
LGETTDQFEQNDEAASIAVGRTARVARRATIVTVAVDTELRERSMGWLMALTALTLGVNVFAYCYLWARDLNCLHRREHHRIGVVLLVLVLTFGLAYVPVVGWCLAGDIERLAFECDLPNRREHLRVLVLTLLIGAIVLGFFSAGIAIPLSIGASAAGFWLLQSELNRLIRADADTLKGGTP